MISTHAQVNFFSLYEVPYEINLEIFIDKKIRTYPLSGISEIDSVLAEVLNDADDFHARLKLDRDHLQLTVLGSSWLGSTFEKRIMKGFEIIKKIDHELRDKYPRKSWNDRDVKWHYWNESFSLVEK